MNLFVFKKVELAWEMKNPQHWKCKCTSNRQFSSFHVFWELDWVSIFQLTLNNLVWIEGIHTRLMKKTKWYSKLQMREKWIVHYTHPMDVYIQLKKSKICDNLGAPWFFLTPPTFPMFFNQSGSLSFNIFLS
jgi:hypothetical protein